MQTDGAGFGGVSCTLFLMGENHVFVCVGVYLWSCGPLCLPGISVWLLESRLGWGWWEFQCTLSCKEDEMTVKELIEELKKHPGNTEVRVDCINCGPDGIERVEVEDDIVMILMEISYHPKTTLHLL